MQAAGTDKNSRDLSAAIGYLEELLNNKDGESVIAAIKKYKQSQNPDEVELF